MAHGLKKKGSLAGFVQAVKARKSAQSATVSLLLGSTGGYFVTRTVGRLASFFAEKRWPNAAKHIDPLVSAATFGGLYFGSGKMEWMQPYREAALAGSAIAALQSLLVTYLPSFAWVLPAPMPQAVLPPTPTATHGLPPFQQPRAARQAAPERPRMMIVSPSTQEAPAVEEELGEVPSEGVSGDEDIDSMPGAMSEEGWGFGDAEIDQEIERAA